MESKFEGELKKIIRLLDKVEDELPIDDSTMDYKTFFNNADKIFEIYNICMEEMCGQLILLNLPDHSKTFKKLYHQYKQQLYNIMKFQLVIQKELNDQYDLKKKSRNEADKLEQKLKEAQEKIKNLEMTLNDKTRKNKDLSSNLNYYKSKMNKENLSHMADAKQAGSKRLRNGDVMSDDSFESSGNNSVVFEDSTESDMGGSSGSKMDQSKKKRRKSRYQSIEDLKQFEIEEDDPEEQNEENELLDKINTFLESKIEDRSTTEVETKMKQNMTLLMKQLDKQKMKIIGLNAKVQTLNLNKDKVKTRTPRRAQTATQTTENYYSEEQIMVIYEKLNEHKDMVKSLKETEAKLEQKIESQLNEIEDKNILNSNLKEEAQQKTKRILELEVFQSKFLEVRKKLQFCEKDFKQVKGKLSDANEKLEENGEKLRQMNDINETLQTSLKLYEEQDLDTLRDKLEALEKENRNLRRELNIMENDDMSRFSEAKIEEHLKNVLTQKNNKIEMLENELLEKEFNSKELGEKNEELSQSLKQNQKNIKDLQMQYDQLLEKKNKLKNYAKSLRKRVERLKEKVGKTGHVLSEESEEPKLLSETSNDKLMVEWSTQTEYFSPVETIISNKDEVLFNEHDLEKIKKAIDVLCRAIGFENFEDVMGNQLPAEDNELKTLTDNKLGKKRKKKSKTRSKRSVNPKSSHKKVRPKSPKNKENSMANSRSKLKYPKKKFNKKKDFILNQMKGQKSRQVSKRQEGLMPEIQIRAKRKQRLEEIFQVNSNDKVVEKTKIYIDRRTNQVKEEIKKYTIPMELNVSKRVVPVIERTNTIEQVRSFEKKLIQSNDMTMQALEREKIVFRMFLNIKKRYRFNPNKFIRLFKLYLNEVPVFQKRLENYDPEKFLFDFSEFKEHFKGLVRMHLICGEECLHLKRFYKKVGLPNKNRKIYGETIFLNTLRLEDKKNWALDHTEI